jgi:hypothetical protein
MKVPDHRERAILRSPQEKAIEFLLGRLMPKAYLTTFIDVMISDMRLSSQLSSEPVKDDRELEMREKSRESIIQILGCYLSKCKDSRYEILEYFSKAEIYDKKLIRQTFLMEVLNENTNRNFTTKLEEYILKKKLGHSKNMERILLKEDITFQ